MLVVSETSVPLPLAPIVVLSIIFVAGLIVFLMITRGKG